MGAQAGGVAGLANEGEAAEGDAVVLGQAGGDAVGAGQQVGADLPERAALLAGLVGLDEAGVLEHAGGVEEQRDAVGGEQGAGLAQLGQADGVAAGGVAAQLDADQGQAGGLVGQGLGQGLEVGAAAEELGAAEVVDVGSGQFGGAQAALDLAKQPGGEQQVLGGLAAGRLERGQQGGLGGATGLEQDGLGQAQQGGEQGLAGLAIVGQRGGGRDGGDGELGPGIGLEVVADQFGGEVERVPTGGGQGLAALGAVAWRVAPAQAGSARDGLAGSAELGAGAAEGVGDHHQQVEQGAGICAGGADQVDLAVDGAELVLELEVAGAQVVLGAHGFEQVLEGGVGVGGICDLGAERAAQAEDLAALGAQGGDDLGDGELQAAERHRGSVELEVHQVAARAGEAGDEDGVDERAVEVGQEQAVLAAVQLAGQEFVAQVVDQGVDLGLAGAPGLDQAGQLGAQLGVGEAVALARHGVAAGAEFLDQVAQAAHGLALERELGQVLDALVDRERGGAEGLVGDLFDALLADQVEGKTLLEAPGLELGQQGVVALAGTGIGVG